MISTPHNGTTAALTFFNEVTTTESISDGALQIIDRNGTTTIYLNSAPASFTNPDSFRSGIPIQTSTLHQQAIVDTSGGTFTAVFANTISSTSAFSINGIRHTVDTLGAPNPHACNPSARCEYRNAGIWCRCMRGPLCGFLKCVAVRI